MYPLLRFQYGTKAMSQSAPSSLNHPTLAQPPPLNPEDNPHHPSSPLFIQPDENASSPLVPKLLNLDNYVLWARSM